MYTHRCEAARTFAPKRRVYANWVAVAVVAVMLSPVVATGQTLASYRFSSPGWATFGLALPQGKALSGVQVSTLPTQTDVKTTWPDGSVRFAVVTAKIPSAGTFPISPKTQSSGSFSPAWPTARVSFMIGGVPYNADLPPFTATSEWLNGPLVRESRVIVVPTSSAGTHPLLQVIYDVRSYTGGGHRVDITVQNVRDVAAMDKVAYDLTVTIASAVVYSKPGVNHYSFTRWRKAFASGLTEATVEPDFEPFYQSAALPRFLSTVIGPNYDTSSAAWDINGFASMNPQMEAGGYRPELSPVPAWQAQYLVHKSASQRSATLLSGNNSGSWSMHITKPDGVSLIKVTEPGYETYWFDYFKRNGTGPGPAVPLRPDNNMRGIRKNVVGGYSDVESSADPEHLPNLTYVPYLVTGDRYYLDQTKLWATWAVINLTPRQPAYPEPVFVPGFDRSRRGSKGLIWTRGLTRELGHPLLVLAEAGVSTPDADPDKAYFETLMQNQLDALGEYVRSAVVPAGGVSEAMGWETWVSKDGSGTPNGRYMSLWRLSYTVFAVDFAAQQQMWTMGNSLDFCRRAVRSQVGFITHGTTSSEKIPSYPTVATLTNGGTTLSFFSSWADLFLSNKVAGSQLGTSPPVGYHGVEAHVLLTVGRRLSVPGADNAYQWLLSYQDSYGTVLGDLNVRSGYAVALSPVGPSPGSPSNVVIQ